MDIVVYCIAAAFVAVLLWFVTKKNVKKQGAKEQKPQVATRQEAVIGPGGVRRRQGRSRLHRNIERQQQLQQEQQEQEEEKEKKTEGEDSDSNSDSETESKKSSKKIGTKKQKKLQLKEEKRKVREATEREREKQKIEEEKLEQARLKQDEEEKLEEERKAAELKRLKEEREKREEEEYLKLAASFEIEEEGNEQGADEAESEHAVEDFIKYVIESKVIFLEDLASHFGLRTQDAIEKVQLLLKEGRLTGVIDDRGKFIYITMDELKAVADFIERRGRVSISELARASNSLINIKVEKDLKLST